MVATTQGWRYHLQTCCQANPPPPAHPTCADIVQCPSPTNPALQLSIDFPALGSAGWTPQVAARVVATIADAAELPRRKVNVTDFRPFGSAMVGTYHGVEAVVSVATPWPDVVGGRLVRARAALQELRATGRPDETRIRNFITKISECQRRAGA